MVSHIQRGLVEDKEGFLKAYSDFRKSVDFDKVGYLPELDNLVWYMLMGVPQVPADDDPDENAQFIAVDQRLNILKAVFVEVNGQQTDDFLDQGMVKYDQASKMAKKLLKESEPEP